MGDRLIRRPLVRRPSLTSRVNSEFLRAAINVQGGQLAWLIGAGGSAMSGIPTAGQLIVRFKHQLYCDANGLDVQDVDPADARHSTTD